MNEPGSGVRFRRIIGPLLRYALMGCSALLAAIVGCNPPRPASPNGGAGRGPAIVEVASIELANLPQQIPAVGTVYAAEETVVSSKVAGILIRTAVDVGQTVRRGDLLFEIEPANYRYALREAEAALDQSLAQLGVAAVPGTDFDVEQTASVRRAKAMLSAAEFTNERLQAMRVSGENRIVAEQELSDARRDLDVALAELEAARDTAKALLATTRQREAALAVARRRVEDTTIEAPPIPTTLAALRAMGGSADPGPAGDDVDRWVVVDRLATEGQFINAANPIYRLMVNDFVLVRAQISQRYAGQISLGLAVEIELPEGPRPIGYISRIRPAIDPLNRTYEVDVLVDNRGRRSAAEAAALRPGAFAKLTITTSQSDAVAWVPARAVRTTAGVSSVFVLDAENQKSLAREVTVIRRASGRVAVAGTFHTGEQLIVRGVESLTDGTAVKLADSGRPAESRPVASPANSAPVTATRPAASAGGDSSRGG